ncbi:hypothetical protein [Cloacibacterium sp.]|uniref:hypothetical protein n=1 Tax=Cloacibacterium sp. TaxID=1913682 RepID=UPI0039E381C0
METNKSFFERIIDVISWLKIVASPTLFGIAVGFFLKIYFKNDLGDFLFGFFIVFGIIFGIYLANRMSKKYGATNFISKVDASPDIDEFIKDKK